MKPTKALILAVCMCGICYGVGFRHGRYSRPVPYVEAPQGTFQFSDENISEGFLRTENAVYFSWDESLGCVTAYSETSGILDQVRSTAVIRYSPLTGEPISKRFQYSDMIRK